MPAARPEPSRAFWIGFLLLLAVGIFLRFQQIGLQWLTDDEWHAVHKLVDSDGYAPILHSFGRADYSIPLTLFDKLLADSVGLSELRMRLPMLLAGTLFLALAVPWAHRRLGTTTALVFGFLIAVSPLLVNYSRNARPYMLTLLLAALAVWALARWERRRRRRDAAVYVGCAWLAGWLHLVMAPFVLALLAPLYLRRMTHADDGPGWRSLLAVTALAVAGMLALNLPPLLGDPAAMAEKTGSGLPSLDTLIGVWHIWLGTASPAVVMLGLTLAALGLGRLHAAWPRELAMWLAGLAAIAAAILVMRPAWVHNPLTFGRYLLPLLPLLLLAIAAGIGVVVQRIPGAALRPPAAVGLAALFLAGTPHAALLRQPNNFTLHSYYQFDYRPRHNPVRLAFEPYRAPSPFWIRLAEAPPGSLTVAVAGQPGFESYFVLHPLYQPLHRQTLLNLQTGGACGPQRPGEAFRSRGIHLRNAVSLADPVDTTRRGVDWIVLEYRQLMPGLVEIPRAYRDYIGECRKVLVARFGPPAYEDGYLTAFRLQSGSRAP